MKYKTNKRYYSKQYETNFLIPVASIFNYLYSQNANRNLTNKPTNQPPIPLLDHIVHLRIYTSSAAL